MSELEEFMPGDMLVPRNAWAAHDILFVVSCGIFLRLNTWAYVITNSGAVVRRSHNWLRGYYTRVEHGDA
jgi:hypothetical protein